MEVYAKVHVQIPLNVGIVPLEFVKMQPQEKSLKMMELYVLHLVMQTNAFIQFYSDVHPFYLVFKDIQMVIVNV